MREYKKGGYAIIDLASTTIYKDGLDAVASNKPVVVYDLPNVYFADTIRVTTIDDDKVVVITKGGKTITITDANSVSSEGNIQEHLYEHRITIFGSNSNGDDYYIRIFVNNNSNTPFTYQMLDNFKFNGVIVDSQFGTKAIEELAFDFNNNELSEIYSVYDNETINAYAFHLDDLTITDEITQLI